MLLSIHHWNPALSFMSSLTLNKLCDLPELQLLLLENGADNTASLKGML